MKFLHSAVAGLLLVLPAVAWADDETLEEIVVTAGFREYGLLNAPGSVSVIDENLIRDRAAQHLETVLSASPNVGYSGGASRARFLQIRGVGDLEQFVDPKHFPSVGILLDDIDLGGISNAGMLFDTRQVEIQRGPQGTRFGTNALGGIVNIRSNAPTDTFEGLVDLGAGNYGSWNAGAVLSGPLSETVGARLAVHRHESDGYVDNTFLDRDDTNGYEETVVRARMKFEPNDTAAYWLTGMYFDSDNGYDAFSLDNDRDTMSDQPGHDKQEMKALAGRGEWQIGESLTIEAIAGWTDSDSRYGFDEDWTFVGICDGTLCDPVFDFFSNTDDYHRDRNDTSLDLRLLGDTAGGTRYVLGLYAQKRDEDLRRQYYGAFDSDYDTKRRAVYGQVETPLGDRFTFTAGYRYEKFEDDYDDSLGFASDSDDTLHSGELTLAWHTAPGPLLYGTVSRGSKPGGVNTEASANLPFMQPMFQAFMDRRLRVPKETLLNKEVGIKGAWLDDRLSVRAALFHMDRDNAQLESWMWDGVNFLWIGFLDGVDGTSYGAEAELTYQLSPRIQFDAAFGWLETDIDEITTFDLDEDMFVTRDNIDQAKSPQWQYHMGASVALGEALDGRVEVEGRDDSQYGYYHEKSIDGYTLVHASLIYRLGRTELQLWGRNLTDEDYAVHGLYFGNDPRKGWVNETYYQYGEPRVYGVSARYAF